MIDLVFNAAHLYTLLAEFSGKTGQMDKDIVSNHYIH